jgi:putative tricarboxylic transport membrane protein
MKISIIRKLSIPILFSIISIIYLYGIGLIDSGYDEGIFGATFVPIISVLFIFILIIVDAINSIKENKTFEIKKINFKPISIFTIATVTYLILFHFFGYLVSTPLYVSAVYVCFSDEKISIPKAILTSIMVTAIFYFLFSVIFNVRLPVFLGS